MLSRYGIREWGLSALAAAVIGLGLFSVGIAMRSTFLTVASVLPALLWLPLALFFRDPPRRIPDDTDVIVSPADGVVKDIEIVDSLSGDGKKYNRIGIFLSIFDVHINRMPADVTVRDARHADGAFNDARSPLAALENESNTIFCDARLAGKPFPLIIRQISGAIARRIVSEATAGKKFKKGERFGMIKFGSRTELHLPLDPDMEIIVTSGDRVYAGSSIVARLRRNAEASR